MKTKPNFALAISATALLLALPALADTGSDAFDRQVQSVNQRLRMPDVAPFGDSAPAAQPAGAAGRAGETMRANGAPADTGSRAFDRYVEQLGRQIRSRNESGQ